MGAPGGHMPDQSTVRTSVLGEISKASGVPKAQLTDAMTLRDDLVISHENLVPLAQILRSFIKASAPGETLLLKEIDTASATVGSVVKLVYDRSNA
jgi:hypothetical protein